MKKLLVPLLVLAGVQGVLVAGYLLFGRDAPGDGPAPPVRAERLDGPAPALRYRTLAGEERQLSALRGRWVLVHFWATWCPPCREELPGLLALAASPGELGGPGSLGDPGELTVLAVSLDPGWEPVSRFLGGRVPPAVVLAAPGAADAFGVTTLPETLLIDGAGRLRLRLAGAHDWRARPVRQIVRQTIEDFVQPTLPAAPRSAPGE